MTVETNLSKRMRKLHKEGTHILPDNWLELADKFDEGVKGFYHDNPQTINVAQFMGRFARARKAWCKATGEPLI